MCRRLQRAASPCACVEWSGSSCTSGRTHTCRAAPGGRTPRDKESGTRCPARIDQTRWSLSCCCLPTPDRTDGASPARATAAGRRRRGGRRRQGIQRTRREGGRADRGERERKTSQLCREEDLSSQRSNSGGTSVEETSHREKSTKENVKMLGNHRMRNKQETASQEGNTTRRVLLSKSLKLDFRCLKP